MYKHLQLFNLNGLKECSLSDLGQINVICGKNNSGKSTLLEAITKTEYRNEGKAFSQDEAIKMFNSTKQQMGWGGENPRFDSEYKNILVQFMSQPKTWYSNEGDVFASELEKLFRKNGVIGNHAYSRQSVVKTYNSLFGINKNTVLIPPKRQLELSKKIQ